MRIGFCGNEERFPAAAGGDFSYAEMNLSKLHDLDGAALDLIQKKADDAALAIDGFNCFFAKSLSLYDGDLNDLVAYAEKNFAIAKRLGGKYCVIGSGQSRSVPEGMDRGKAEERFLFLMDRLGALAGKSGLCLMVEPLRRSETNLINTLSDGIRFCRALGNPGVGCLVDFFHFTMNGEDLSEFDELRPGELTHVHLARPDPDRGDPKKEDVPALCAWNEKLRSIGYAGRISLECRWNPDFDTAAKPAAKIAARCFA